MEHHQQQDPRSLGHLEAVYGQLCTEKCRILNSIEVVNRESRSIQQEIHRMLDVLAESLKPQELMMEEGGGLFSDSEGELFGDEQAGGGFCDESEGEDLAGLQHEQQFILQIQETLKKTKKRGIDEEITRRPSPNKKSFSLSTTTTTTKARRSYKSLPMDEDGNVQVPLILGRALNRICINSLGQVMVGRPEWTSDGGQGYIYPCDYECRRNYGGFDNAPNDESSKLAFLCRIFSCNDNTERPMFEIIAKEPTTSSVDGLWSCRSGSLEEIWTAFTERFAPHNRTRLLSDISGPGAAEAFFGLDHDNLRPARSL